MCTFGIDELRQHTAEILLLWRHAEEHAFRAHVPVESLHVGDSEPQFDLSSRVLFGSRVQRESGIARHELTPARRFELKLETEHITVEIHCLVHVGDELDHVSKLCSFHFDSSTEPLTPIIPTDVGGSKSLQGSGHSVHGMQPLLGKGNWTRPITCNVITSVVLRLRLATHGVAFRT